MNKSLKTVRGLISFAIMFVCVSTISALAQNNDGFTISTTDKNPQTYNGVTVSNGIIGVVGSTEILKCKEVVIAGTFDREHLGGVSRVVRGAHATDLFMAIDGKPINNKNTTSWSQTLDMKKGELTTFVTNEGTARISHTQLALRQHPHMAMGVVEVTAQRDLELEVSTDVLVPIENHTILSKSRKLQDAAHFMPVYVTEAETRTKMNVVASATSFVFCDDKISQQHDINGTEKGMGFKYKMKKGETLRFGVVGAWGTSREFSEPRNECERMAVYAVRVGLDQLLNKHYEKWDELWEGDIIIEGAPLDQLDVRLAMYSLYSFAREGSRESIAPMGLSTSTGYNGHIFWDSEIWMFPPLLVLNNEIARSMVDYRTDRLDKAIQRAKMFGYKGAMFPWESDASGEEATPTWCLTGTFEHHITADIAIAFWDYYRVTKNTDWLKNEGYYMIKNVADFWTSRVTDNNDGTYSIINVIGANEYAPNVDDNAFTNGAAKTALIIAEKAAKILGEKPNPNWTKVANGIVFENKKGVTLEHSKYNGEMIKQADVNLLSYPLNVITDKEQIERDLIYYQSKIDTVHGPAMGYSILSVLNSEMGNEKVAYELFRKSYIPNRREPFGVLSESPASNNPYFATGAGGMLQAVINGFLGLRVTDKGIEQVAPMLPKQWQRVTITGVGPYKKTFMVEKKKIVKLIGTTIL